MTSFFILIIVLGLIYHFEPYVDLEEVFENREQIEISKHYEKLPKPTSIAIQEWLDDEIYFRSTDERN